MIINKLNNDYELNTYQHALNLTTKRQELLANNIANADTPNFKARDIKFASILQEKLEKKSAVADVFDLSTTSSKQISNFSTETFADSEILYRIPLQPSADGNTVDMNLERTQFAENSIKYDVILTLLKDKFGDLIQAMQEK